MKVRGDVGRAGGDCGGRVSVEIWLGKLGDLTRWCALSQFNVLRNADFIVALDGLSQSITSIDVATNKRGY